MLFPKPVDLSTEGIGRAASIELHITHLRALRVGRLSAHALKRLEPCQPSARLESRDPHLDGRIDADDHVEAIPLARLGQQGNIVHDDGNTVVAGLPIGGVRCGENIGMNDVVEPRSCVVVGKDHGSEFGPVQLPVAHDPVSELSDNVREGARAGFHDTPCKHIVVNDTRAELAETGCGRRLASTYPAREPNP